MLEWETLSSPVTLNEQEADALARALVEDGWVDDLGTTVQALSQWLQGKPDNVSARKSQTE